MSNNLDCANSNVNATSENQITLATDEIDQLSSLELLSHAASSSDGKAAAMANSTFAYYYPHALAAAAAGLEPFAAMAKVAGMSSLYPFPPQLLHEAALAAAVAVSKDQSGPVDGLDSSESRGTSPSDGLDSESNKEKYICPTCNRGFSRMYNLKSHIKTHQNHRPFYCQMCDMRFTRNHDLNRHMRTHSKEKPHLCHACGRTFARRDALRRHERMDAEGKKIHCTPTNVSSMSTMNQSPLAHFSPHQLAQLSQMAMSSVEVATQEMSNGKLHHPSLLHAEMRHDHSL